MHDEMVNCLSDATSTTFSNYMISLYWTVATVSSLGFVSRQHLSVC